MLNIAIKLFDGTLYPVGDVYSIQGAEVVITTIADSQKIAEVELYLVDEKNSKGAPFIGKFTIRDIPEAQAGVPRFTLIIKADQKSNLDVLVYDKGKLSGKMEIPASSWHPDFKSKTAAHILLEKKGGADKRDFEVHFKSEKEKADASGPAEMAAVPREEKMHYISSEAAEEKKSWGMGLLIGGLLLFASIVAALFFLRPWEGIRLEGSQRDRTVITSPQTEDSGKTLAEDDSGALVETPEPEPEITPVPTAAPFEIAASVNSKIRDTGYIYFMPNTTQILPESAGKLQIMSDILKEHRGVLRVEVRGHTARIGTEGEQFELSVERAKIVARELSDAGSVDGDSITSQGVGATEPATMNAEKIELNRRVEVEAFAK